MTRVFYDTEFLEDGERIHLISIGMVREDGTEYYAVNSDADWKAIARHRWLCENVVPHLPLTRTGTLPHLVTPASHHSDVDFWFTLDEGSALVKPQQVIANEVRDFILGVPDPELWADYCAYDHVRLAQLWGPMIRLPEGIPMWTHELRQEWERLGKPDLPSLPGAREHNALDDAREVKFRYEWLAAHAAGRVVRVEPRTGLDKARETVSQTSIDWE